MPRQRRPGTAAPQPRMGSRARVKDGPARPDGERVAIGAGAGGDGCPKRRPVHGPQHIPGLTGASPGLLGRSGPAPIRHGPSVASLLNLPPVPQSALIEQGRAPADQICRLGQKRKYVANWCAMAAVMTGRIRLGWPGFGNGRVWWGRCWALGSARRTAILLPAKWSAATRWRAGPQLARLWRPSWRAF